MSKKDNEEMQIKTLFKKVSLETDHTMTGKSNVVTGYNSDDIVLFMREYMTSRGLFVKNEVWANHNSILPFNHLVDVYQDMVDGSYLVVYVSVKNIPIDDPDTGGTLMKHFYDIKHSICDDTESYRKDILSFDRKDVSFHSTVVFIFQKFNDELQNKIHDEIQQLLPSDRPVSFKNKPYGIQMHTMISTIDSDECGKIKKYGGLISKSRSSGRQQIVLRTNSIKDLNRIKLVCPYLFNEVLKVHYGTKLFRNMKDTIDE